MTPSQPEQPRDRETLTREQVIGSIETTIAQLQSLLSQLNTDGPVDSRTRTLIDRLTLTTEQLNRSIVTKPETVTEIITPAPVDELSQPVVEKVPVIDEMLPSLEKVENSWDKVLNTVRSILPQSLGNKLSDALLTALLTGSLVAVLLTSVLLIPKNSPEIVQNPPETISINRTEPEIIATPPELKAPSVPQPLPVITPTPKLTPEQSLVAAIQSELNDLSSDYSEDTISRVEADFSGSRLEVIVSDNWYALSPSRQDKLAGSLWQRSQRLDFRKLDIINTDGKLIARNPVVGNDIVIIERKKDAAI
ncbi:MAG: hypothetical protein N5P05_001301 [Chroococcopsis gigantea SAG 12.99]|jgi:hypothetical protein|nr:hypothetical protein [Chlorogloea purpurea SAG 13.99]MDV2999695.1 hypothetical protein [Chroococcopsis gigantea SAG 12.99]